VADITLRRRTDVISRLSKCSEWNKSTTVTVRTLTIAKRMIHGSRLETGCNHMAVLARSRRRKVRLLRHCLGFYRDKPTTVTAETSAGDSGMAHGGRCESIEIGVAGVAETCRGNMPTRLGKALASRTVVTAITGMVTHDRRRAQQSMILNRTNSP
jgi:hypothetical protein